MPTVLTHLAVPLAGRAATGTATTSRRLLLAGALASVVPDADALGFFAGVPYESLFGHRGITHSLAFALLLAGCAVACAARLQARRAWVFWFVFLSTASHGVLDALTDGGLGVAFLSPFSNQRFFFPWRPLPVAPIGVDGLLSPYGAKLFAAELAFVWLPCLLLALAARTATRRAGAALAVAGLVAGAYAVGAGPFRRTPPADGRVLQEEAIANLERQVEKLAARDGSSCPLDFRALDGDQTLRISLFHGYDDHEGRVYDRVNSTALLHVLTGPCRGRLSACDFALVSRSTSATTVAKTIRGRRVEIQLVTSSVPDGVRERSGAAAAALEQERLSREARERFVRELVESDVVFYMGHSRLGGGMGFDDQSGATTLVNSLLRQPLAPVLDALRHRPTRLRILGLFSCASERYFRPAFEEANPSLSLILTTGDLRYAPGEQASLGALEAVLSRYCGYAFHDAMIAASEPDPEMTRLVRGR